MNTRAGTNGEQQIEFTGDQEIDYNRKNNEPMVKPRGYTQSQSRSPSNGRVLSFPPGTRSFSTPQGVGVALDSDLNETFKENKTDDFFE